MRCLLLTLLPTCFSVGPDTINYTILKTLKEEDSIVAVIQREECLDMIYDQSIIGSQNMHEELHRSIFSGFAIMQCAAYMDRTISRAIQIGLGAGHVPSFLREKGIVTDVVDISEAVVELATEYFHYSRCDIDATDFVDYLESLHDESEDDDICKEGATILIDGLWFIEHPPSLPMYDVFLIDVYTGYNPGQFYVKEVYELVKNRWLTRSGVLIVNYVTFISGKHAKVIKSINRTLKSVFKHVKAYKENPEIADDRGSNIIHFASDDPISFHLPSTGEYANPYPNTYQKLIVSFTKWEAFFDAPNTIEMDIGASGDIVTQRRSDPSEVDGQILTKDNYKRKDFDEVHWELEEHMRGYFLDFFHSSILEKLDIKTKSRRQ